MLIIRLLIGVLFFGGVVNTIAANVPNGFTVISGPIDYTINKNPFLAEMAKIFINQTPFLMNVANCFPDANWIRDQKRALLENNQSTLVPATMSSSDLKKLNDTLNNLSHRVSLNTYAPQLTTDEKTRAQEIISAMQRWIQAAPNWGK